MASLPPDQILWRILFEIRRGWKAFFVLGGLAVAILSVYVWRDAWIKAEGKPIEAVITSFGADPISEKFTPGRIEVSAVSEDGVVGRLSVPADRLVGCRVGDRIAAEKVGASLRLNPGPC